MTLTVERLKELLEYNPITGEFLRRASRGGKHTGSVAGGVNADGYISICIDRRFYYGHRLAWFYVKGEWPPEVDHRNGHRSFNAWNNLRLATRHLNNENARRRDNNTSGYKGVSWSKACGRWRAYIRGPTGQRHLGLFDDPRDAHEAYMTAAREYFGEFARAA